MIGSLEVVIFLTLSGLAAGASLHAWRTRLAYGSFRFAGFECLALLVAWNARRWFHDPVSAPQILSWIILVGATLLAGHGVHILRSLGGARHRVMEDTVTVVEVGAYRHIRHPMYASLLLVGWAVWLKGIDLPGFVLAALATLFWVATARSEERFNSERFGAEYAEYVKRTRMFVPFVM